MVKRSMIVDDSLSKSRNVLRSFFISCSSRSQLHYHHSLQKFFPSFRYFDAISCFWQPRFQCFLDDVFLLFLVLLIFSFSASLSSKYSSKFRLSSSPDDRIFFESRSAAILEMLQLSRKTIVALSLSLAKPLTEKLSCTIIPRSNRINYYQLSCRI